MVVITIFFQLHTQHSIFSFMMLGDRSVLITLSFAGGSWMTRPIEGARGKPGSWWGGGLSPSSLYLVSFLWAAYQSVGADTVTSVTSKPSLRFPNTGRTSFMKSWCRHQPQLSSIPHGNLSFSPSGPFL